MPLLLDSFWDGNGSDVLNKHLHNENEFVSNIANLIHQKAKLDMEYSSGLLKIAKSYASSGKDELGTSKELWDTFRAELETQAKLFQTLSTELSETVVKPLASFRDEQAKTRKNIEKKISTAEKNFSNAKSAQKKAEKSYLSKEKELESAYDAYDKNPQDPKTDKNLKKVQKDSEPVVKEYKGATKKAHFEKGKWEEAMIQTCIEVEDMERARITFSREQFEKYIDNHTKIIPAYEDSFQRIKQKCSEIDIENDITAFVQLKQTGQARPEELLYRSYALDSKNQMAQERRKQSLQIDLQDLEQDLESERKAISGLEGLIKIYNEQPSYTNDSGMITTQRQLVHVQEYVDILQNHINLYEDTLSNLGGTKLAGNKLSGSYSSSPYTPTSTYTPSPTTSNYSNEPQGSYQQLYVALYDFEASNEGEISMKQGQQMEVLDASDPDWWQVQLGGITGYVPATYLEQQS